MTERQLVTKIEKMLRMQNIYYIKTADKYTSGIPDLIVFYKGVEFWEVKLPTGRVAPIQHYVLGRINASGSDAVVIKSVEEAKKRLDNKNLFDKISKEIDRA
jgi:hypothetical protein